MSAPLKAYGRGKAADLVTGAGRIERLIEQANAGSTPVPTLQFSNPKVKSGDGQMWDLNGRPGYVGRIIRPFKLRTSHSGG